MEEIRQGMAAIVVLGAGLLVFGTACENWRFSKVKSVIYAVGALGLFLMALRVWQDA